MNFKIRSLLILNCASSCLTLLSLSVYCSFAGAEELKNVKWQMKGKLRADSLQSTTKTTVGDSESVSTKSSQIRLARAQFEFVGKSDAAEFRLKYLADKNYLRYAFITKNLTDEISVSAGKLDARDFAWEWDYSSTEQYLYGRAGSHGSEGSPGAEVKFSAGDHAIFAQVLQGAKLYTTGDKIYAIDSDSKGGLTTTLQYRGELLDKLILPIMTYSQLRMAASKFTLKDGTTTTEYNFGNGYQTHVGVGVKIVAAGSTSDLEYNLVKIHKQKDTDTSKEGTVTSIIMQSRLPAIADFTPYLKFVADADKK
ncbi:MAG: hypothetical protein NTV34_21540, partial [Proteobacteria bacterium]|nr:hypothetical protein [Pseudomonadota bacterium]